MKTRKNDAFFLEVVPYTLHFINPAGTSRGVMNEHHVWYIHMVSIEDPQREGWGECAPLPGLSCDDVPEYESILHRFCSEFEYTGQIDFKVLEPYPSMLFGFETACQSYGRGNHILFESSFSRGISGIPINGLIWMDTIENMAVQIERKLQQGYSCIKLKIGSLNFEEEIELLERIRKRFPSTRITLRVDANGAFTTDIAQERLDRLAALDIHSIEQPIMAGQWDNMAELAARSKVPIALDEELIGIHTTRQKEALLDTIKPHFLVLKPSLHGGFRGCEEWIRLAESRSIGWWVTSALESNIGLNAIAQWCATLPITTHQGLGTGMLYRDNITVPLQIRGENLWFDPTGTEIPAGVLVSEPENPETKRTIQLHGITYDWIHVRRAYEDHLLPFLSITDALMEFLEEWFDPSPYLTIMTSGTTGSPTSITVKKSLMVQSARQTCDFFGLKQDDDCLLCLSLHFIAAKMMVVRALVRGLNLWLKDPDGNPFEGSDKSYAFVPLVPLQVYNTLNTPREKDVFLQCGTILIGGGLISPTLEVSLKTAGNAIFASYGMAETLSHIAIRRLSGPTASDYYTPFPSVRLTLTRERCLSIEAPLVCESVVRTRDVAELLPDGRFRILGRLDNLILTGGMKVQAEILESIFGSAIDCDFAITSAPDPKYGEQIVLVAEHPVDLIALQALVPSWQLPKRVIVVSHIPRTENGKVDRKRLKDSVRLPQNV